MRLDIYLVEKGYYPTRNKALTAIKDNAVMVDGKVITKANYDINDDTNITIVKESNPYVSRGGLKLEAAIKAFYLDFNDKVVLDIGASTGGFTDCALKHGAKLVYAVDVGTNQLAETLKNRSDVVVYEQTNIIDVESFPHSLDYIVMDVSFVSITKILPAIDKFINDNNALVCLIKPQFEVGKIYLKNGIVKDRNLHISVLKNIFSELERYNLGVAKLIPSPILGGSGNKEFLALIKRNIKSNINIIEVCR